MHLAKRTDREVLGGSCLAEEQVEVIRSSNQRGWRARAAHSRPIDSEMSKSLVDAFSEASGEEEEVVETCPLAARGIRYVQSCGIG